MSATALRGNSDDAWVAKRCSHSSVQERVWMLEEMCIDIGVNVCVDTFEHVYGHKHGHVYRHVY